MDLRAQTSLMAAALAAAIATAVLLRPRRRAVHWLFAGFAGSVALWYATAVLRRMAGEEPWSRVNLVCAVLLPLAGVRFFRAFIDEQGRGWMVLSRLAVVGALGLLAGAVITPIDSQRPLGVAVFVYVLTMLAASMALLFSRSRVVRSRFERARLRYLTLVGALAATFTLADYLPYVGLEIPPVGTILTLVFLYVLSQSILRYRLIDLYELAGRLTVLTALSFTIATIFWFLVGLAGGNFFFHSVSAALVLLLLFDPIRTQVEQKIAEIFFRERFDLERVIDDLRRQLAHVFEADEVPRLLLEGLERSRRVTHAAVYFLDEDLRGYGLAGHLGPGPVPRVDRLAARPLLERLVRDRSVDRDALDRELKDHRELGREREAETLHETIRSLEAMNASLCLAIQGEGKGPAPPSLGGGGSAVRETSPYGLLVVDDERLRDAFSPEDVVLLEGLAAQAAIALENSRLYQRLKNRDRLAALGEMAAGLAHEIRNPLGAIKAAAQYLEADADEEERAADRPGGASGSVPSDREDRGLLTDEFLRIIVDEVDRLDRVVSSFLDYARPSTGDPIPADVNAAIERTLRLLEPQCREAGIRVLTDFDGLAPRVRIDLELLRQVLINLFQNAIQAMEHGGDLTVETRRRARESGDPGAGKPPGPGSVAEIRVRDTGPGIPKAVLANLFVPFVTTKTRGTGLGLAISQRIVVSAGGRIDVRTRSGVGSTFVVVLPEAEEEASASTAPALAAPAGSSPSPGQGPRVAALNTARGSTTIR